MAYKNAYGAAGTLTASLPASGTAQNMQVDTTLAAILRSFLGTGDWTYLLIGAGTTAEVVQVQYSATTSFPVLRAQDGTTPRLHAPGDPAVFQITAVAIAAAVPPQTLTVNTSGAITATQPTATELDLSVPPPNFTGNGIAVSGAYPNYEFTLTEDDTGCCGSGTSSGGSTLSLYGNGLVEISQSGSTATITVEEPAFTGSGLSITGTWPNLNFAVNTSGAGTVTSVTGGSGITVTGSPSVNPTVSLSASGVTAGTYGGLQVDAFGRLIAIDPTFNPPDTISAVNSWVLVARTGNDMTIDVVEAAEGTIGVVALANASAPLDSTDHSTAVNPALLASVISALAGTSVAGFTTNAGEATNLYTNIVSASPTSVVLAAGEQALVRATLTMLNTATPATPVQFGMAIFNTTGPTIIQGNRSITQSQQTIDVLLTGPLNIQIALASTAVPSGATVNSSSLTVTTFPG